MHTGVFEIFEQVILVLLALEKFMLFINRFKIYKALNAPSQVILYNLLENIKYSLNN